MCPPSSTPRASLFWTAAAPRPCTGKPGLSASKPNWEGLVSTSRFATKRRLSKGVGGNIQSDVVKVYPVGLAKVHGEMCSSEAPGPLPLLLSRPFVEEMGTVMDIGRGTVSFTALGVRDLPLVKTSRGHLAVDLLDFDRGSLAETAPEPEPDALVPRYEVRQCMLATHFL